MKKVCISLLAALLALALMGCTPSTIQSDDGPAVSNGYQQGGSTVVMRDGFTNIDIQWLSGSVTVELFDGADPELSETLSGGGTVENPMEWRVHESTLTIRQQSSLFSAGESKDLTVKLPRSLVLRELDVETSSAAISVALSSDFPLADVEIETLSGAVSLNGVTANDVSLSTNSGSVSGDVSAAELDMDTTSGLFTLTLNGLPAEVDGESISGCFDLTLSESAVPAAPLLLQFRTTSGALQCDVPYTLVPDDGQWEFHTTSGSVTIAAA